MPILVPILLLVGGGALILTLVLTDEKEPPVHEPDVSPAPVGKTGYKRVDAILDELKKAASSSGIPLGLLVGWIAKESGGRLDEVTKLGERGLFQLMPAESAALGVDHARLSTDLTYSINAGLMLIARYMGFIDKLNAAVKGTAYYWLLVKLAHTMGEGATQKIVAAAKAAGDANSWKSLEAYALDHDTELLHLTKHRPSKWFPFIDALYAVGQPFGFGESSTVVVGGSVLDDIPDPMHCKKRG